MLVLAGAVSGPLLAQDARRTVADGVFTDTQAERGAGSYSAACSGCHRPDLAGATGPSLKEQQFAKGFAGKDLSVLYAKVATMPRNAPGSLGENVYLDIVAHILKENGFAAGATELTADVLPAVSVIPGKAKPPPAVGDFSYVETVGCLTAGPEGTWLLTNAADANVVVPPIAADRGAYAGGTTSRGTKTFRLLDAMAYSPASHRGHTMYVRGLLVRLPNEERMTISAFEMVGASCER